jgi:hypothetical protein
MKVWAMFGFMLLLSVGLNATTTTHKNSLGTPMYQDNPNSYRVGAVLSVAYVGNGKGMVVRIQPAGTYSLFTEDVLFCGTEVEQFVGKTNPMAITYETQAHSTVEGIGCHRLLRVDSLKEVNELP